MNDVDDSVVIALQDRAEGPVDVESLLAGARKRGIQRRRIRNVMAAAGVSCAVALTVGVVAQLSGPAAKTPALQPGSPSTAQPSPSQQAGTIVRPPLSTGTAYGNPELLHLDVADDKVRMLSWKTSTGWESLSVLRTESWQGSFNDYRVAVAASESALTTALQDGSERLPGTPVASQIMIEGQTGKLRLSQDALGSRWGALHWKRADGLWAGVFISFGSNPESQPANDRASVLQVAAWLRTEQVRQCANDFQLAWIPAGFQKSGCEYVVNTEGYLATSAEYQGKGGRKFAVYTTDVALAGPVTPNRTVDGRQLEVKQGWIRYAFADGVAALDRQNGLSESDGIRVIVGFTPR